MTKPVPRLAIAAAGLASLLPTQVPAEGLQATVHALPGSVAAALVHPLGIVTFDGQDLVLVSPAQPPQVVLHLPAPAFASFLADAGGDRVLFADSTDAVWLVPLHGPAPTAPLATVPFAYDAARHPTGRVVVSAKRGGFASADNDLVWLDLATGATATLAVLPGASGPVEVDAHRGDVYYATAANAFPPPPGSCRVLRLPFATIAQATAPLGLQHAQVVHAGLGAASDLALDGDGDLHFTDWVNERIGAIDDATGAAPAAGPVTVDYAAAPLGAVTLQYAPAAPFVFEPFQHHGGTLHVFESDFFATSRLRAVRTAPATLAASAPPPLPAGTVTLTATGGPAHGFGVLAFAALPPGPLTSLPLAGFAQPVLWNAVLLPPPVAVALPFDAGGTASFSFVNPGFAPVLAGTAQVFFVSAAAVVGSTPHLGLGFGQ